jgi:hypothetical protein
MDGKTFPVPATTRTHARTPPAGLLAYGHSVSAKEILGLLIIKWAKTNK